MDYYGQNLWAHTCKSHIYFANYCVLDVYGHSFRVLCGAPIAAAWERLSTVSMMNLLFRWLKINRQNTSSYFPFSSFSSFSQSKQICVISCWADPPELRLRGLIKDILTAVSEWSGSVRACPRVSQIQTRVHSRSSSCCPSTESGFSILAFCSPKLSHWVIYWLRLCLTDYTFIKQLQISQQPPYRLPQRFGHILMFSRS